MSQSQGNLNVKITATDATKDAFNSLDKSLGTLDGGTKKAGESLAKLSGLSASGLVSVATTIGEIGLAAVAAGVGLERMMSSWAHSTIALGQRAKLLGVPIGMLDTLGSAANRAGSSADALGAGLQNLQQGMFDAAGGRNPVMAQFLTLLHQNGHSAVQALGGIADAVQRAKDPMVKLAIATQAFGGAGADLLPLLDKGSRGIEQLTERSKRYGRTTNDSIEASEKFLNSQEDLGQSFRHLEDVLLRDLAPSMSVVLTHLADQVSKIAPELDEWAKNGGPEKLAASVKVAADEVDHLLTNLSGVWNKLNQFDKKAGDVGDAVNDWFDNNIPGMGQLDNWLGVSTYGDRIKRSGATNFAKSNDLGLLKPGDMLGGLLDEAASKSGADPALLRALVNAESGGRMVKAAGSSATGFFQLTSATAKDLGVDANDPTQNVYGGTKRLQQMLALANGNISGAVAAYHDGPSSAGAKWLKGHPGDISHFSRDAIAESDKVKGYYNNELAYAGRGNEISVGGMNNAVHFTVQVDHNLPQGSNVKVSANTKGNVSVGAPKVSRTSTGMN